MSNSPIPRCGHCGAAPTPHRPSLIDVVDEFGVTTVCGLCIITVLARLETSGDVTVFVSRPTTGTVQ